MRVAIAGAAFAAALSFASPALAVNTFYLNGQITSLSDPAGLLGGTSFVGNAFDATVTFDPLRPTPVYGTDVIGTINAGALKIITPNDSAVLVPLEGGATFLGILPANPIVYSTSSGDVRCGGSGGVTLRPDNTASFAFSCGFFGGPVLLAQGIGTFSTVAPSVPEPATWVMMLLGFGAVGFALRRHKVTSCVSYAV